MKIFIVCSKAFYKEIPKIDQKLIEWGYKIFYPHTYENPGLEMVMKKSGAENHAAFKKEMFRKSEAVISETDAILVVNLTKNGMENYIGGSTFLEIYDAFRLGKKIYFWHPIPKGIMADELNAFEPIILNESLSVFEKKKSSD